MKDKIEQHKMDNINQLGIQVFGGAKGFNNWLNRKNFLLNQKRPIDILKKEKGWEMIESMLVRIDQGIFI